MRRLFPRSAVPGIALLLALAVPASAWGDKGHRLSANLALQSLPPGPRQWFEGREEAFRERILEPDQWKATDRKEGRRHFLDLEPYGGPKGVPRDLQAAMEKVGRADFEKLGLLPWIIQDRFRELVQAFRDGLPERVVEAAGHLGHYIGDAQVPLHATVNHDGQLTGQRGVHGRWESGLVERFLEEGELKVRAARVLPDLTEAPFEWLEDSFGLVEKVLEEDLTALATEGRSASRRLAWGLQGSLVKQQLQRSGERLGDAILTAWVAAGRPSPARTAGE